eukprot:1781764-Rhodomonas_salina.2
MSLSWYNEQYHTHQYHVSLLVQPTGPHTSAPRLPPGTTNSTAHKCRSTLLVPPHEYHVSLPVPSQYRRSVRHPPGTLGQYRTCA